MCTEEKKTDDKTTIRGNRFVEGENGVVIEPSKRLLWMKNDTYQLTKKWMSWIQVRDYVDKLNAQRYAG